MSWCGVTDGCAGDYDDRFGIGPHNDSCKTDYLNSTHADMFNYLAD